MKVPAFRYYLFDVDGTLLDSAPDITAAVEELFARHGRTGAVSAEELRSRIGLHLRATFQDVFPDYDESAMQRLIQEYREIYVARNHRATRMFSGAHETLAALEGRKATATTKKTETTAKVLELFGLRRYFDHVQGTDGFPYKPAPDVLLRAMEALGARPEETLMVGDSPVDVEAGRRAGVKVCAVRYGYGASQLSEDDPDYWVEDLRELLG